MPELLDRHVRPLIAEALTDTRVVVVLGARQVGKSTLVEQIAAHDHPAPVLSLDDQATREAARSDPTGFVAGLDPPVVLDEVQRAGDVLLAIKRRVDDDQTPGQFLLTGSANLLTAPRIADALTGRAEYYRLHPFSQGELRGEREIFIPSVFDGVFPQVSGQVPGRAAYAHAIAAGGYPDARARADDRRWRFFESYVDTILQRDLTSLAAVHDSATVRRLLDGLGATSGALLNFEGLSRDTGVPANTLRSHLSLLETLFLVARFDPWHNDLLSRVVKAPKAYLADTGLLSYIVGVNEQRIAEDAAVAGLMFETFVAMELERQARWQRDPPRLFHYRDRDQREVDVVMERRDGSVVGVEVKAAASASKGDFRGLRQLREKLGDRFKAGVLVYTGETTVPFEDRLAAVPMAGLWASTPSSVG
jgi:uncharacterized protein